MSKKNDCRAKDPSNCRYHQAQITFLTASSSLESGQATAQKLNSGELSLAHPAAKATIRKRAEELLYFSDSNDHQKLGSQLLKSIGEEENSARKAVALRRSKEILDFDKAYTKQHGYGHDKAKAAAIQKQFGLNETRYYQLLTSNPELLHAKKQVEASYDEEHGKAKDIIARKEKEEAVQGKTLEKLYGFSMKKALKSKPSEQEVKEMFDRFEKSWEIRRFGGNPGTSEREVANFGRSERNYYEQ